MATKALKRVIHFDDNTLQDIPGMSAEELKTHYTHVYPELVTATAQEEVKDNVVHITFTVGFKAKG